MPPPLPSLPPSLLPQFQIWSTIGSMVFALFFFSMLQMIRTVSTPFLLPSNSVDQIDPNAMLVATEQIIFTAFTMSQEKTNRGTGLDLKGREEDRMWEAMTEAGVTGEMGKDDEDVMAAMVRDAVEAEEKQSTAKSTASGAGGVGGPVDGAESS